MKIYIKSIESIDTSNASFRVGTRWVDTSNGKKFTITEVRGDRIYTDGFNALLPSEEFIGLLKNRLVRPTEDYFLVSSGDEFLGYLDSYETIDSENSIKYILHLSKQEVYIHVGMPKQDINNLIDNLMLYATNYKYTDGRDILELVDPEITYKEK